MVTIAPHVRTAGQISSATSWAMPEHTRKFIAMLWKNESPWWAAAAPTTRPNAMMPGATGSPSRNPCAKRHQPDWPGLVAGDVRPASTMDMPGGCRASRSGSHGYAPRIEMAGTGPAIRAQNWELALRLRGDFARRRFRPRARLAGRRHRG